MAKFEIPLDIKDLEEDGCHLFLECELWGDMHRLVLDTGASRTVFDLPTLLDLKPDLDVHDSETLSAGVGSNEIKSSLVPIDLMKFGGLEVSRYQLAVMDLTHVHYAYEKAGIPKVIGVFGSDLMLKYNAIIDYKKLLLTLED